MSTLGGIFGAIMTSKIVPLDQNPIPYIQLFQVISKFIWSRRSGTPSILLFQCTDTIHDPLMVSQSKHRDKIWKPFKYISGCDTHHISGYVKHLYRHISVPHNMTLFPALSSKAYIWLCDLPPTQYKYALQYHLLNWKCHYFSNECMGHKETTLSLLKDVTISLVSGWVKGNWLNVTKYEVFFFWRRPLVSLCPTRDWSCRSCTLRPEGGKLAVLWH